MNPPLDITPGAWTVFAPYSWLHGVTLLVCLVLIAAPALLGRRLQKKCRTRAALRPCGIRDRRLARL